MLTHSHTFEAIGTQWNIETDYEISNDMIAAIHARIEAFDNTYSRFSADSLVSQVAQQKGEYVFPSDAVKLFGFYRNLYDITSGKVTPLIGTALERAGYDSQYTFKQKPQKEVPKWDDVLAWRGQTLHTSQPITLDIGAAGKGYLVDSLASILDKEQFKEYVIDASGDLVHKGASENNVGLEHPLQPGKVIGVVNVQNKSLCASATNRRAWGKDVHHLFDPDTVSPTRDIIATWVIADETMIADGLATALFFTSPQLLEARYNYDYVRIHANGAVDYSHGFEGKLF